MVGCFGEREWDEIELRGSWCLLVRGGWDSSLLCPNSNPNMEYQIARRWRGGFWQNETDDNIGSKVLAG